LRSSVGGQSKQKKRTKTRRAVRPGRGEGNQKGNLKKKKNERRSADRSVSRKSMRVVGKKRGTRTKSGPNWPKPPSWETKKKKI